MANDVFSGLFQSPTEVAQAQREKMFSGATSDAMRRGMLTGMGIAGVTGAKSKAVIESEKNQKLLNSVDMNDPASIAKGIEAAKAAGLTKVVQFLEGKAASSAAAKRQREIEDRNYALDYAKTQSQLGVDSANIQKILAEAGKLNTMLPLEVRIKQAEAAVAEGTVGSKITQAAGEAASAQAAGEVAMATRGEAISQVGANLAQTYANVGLTQEQAAKLTQDISFAYELQPGLVEKLKNENDLLGLDQALKVLERDKGRALLPHEIAQAALGNELTTEQIAYTKQQSATELVRRQYMGQTDFLKELDQLDLPKEERDAYIKSRVESRLASQTFDPRSAVNQATVGRMVKIAQEGADAVGGMQFAEKFIDMVPYANTGSFLEIKDAATWLGNAFGVASSQQTKFYNELMDVMFEGGLLAQTSILKGVLTDRDMEIIRKSIAGRGNQPEVIVSSMIDFAANKYGTVQAAETFDRLLASNPENLKDVPPDIVKRAVSIIAKQEYIDISVAKRLLSEDQVVGQPSEAEYKRSLELLKKYGIEYNRRY